MSTETRLKPCPFCGGAAKEYDRFNANVITCRKCGVQVRQSEIGQGDAADRWNKRSAPVTAQPDVTQQTLDDVKAGIPARDAEIAALRKEIEALQAAQAQQPVSGADGRKALESAAITLALISGFAGTKSLKTIKSTRETARYAHKNARAALAQQDAETGKTVLVENQGLTQQDADALKVADYEKVLGDSERLTEDLGRLLMGDEAPARPSLCDLVSFVQREGIVLAGQQDADKGCAAAPSAHDREMFAIGRAIERVAESMPEGWAIQISIEAGAGTVHLIYPDSSGILIESGEPLSEQINEAYDQAIDATRKEQP